MHLAARLGLVEGFGGRSGCVAVGIQRAAATPSASLEHAVRTTTGTPRVHHRASSMTSAGAYRADFQAPKSRDGWGTQQRAGCSSFAATTSTNADSPPASRGRCQCGLPVACERPRKRRATGPRRGIIGGAFTLTTNRSRPGIQRRCCSHRRRPSSPDGFRKRHLVVAKDLHPFPSHCRLGYGRSDTGGSRAACDQPVSSLD